MCGRSSAPCSVADPLGAVAGPSGPIEVLVTGDGSPTTLFAHGLAGSITETRPFGSGVDGTRVFFHFRGHGDTPDYDAPWTYDELSDELVAVREVYGARRGVGVSLGAGALLLTAVRQPGVFERLVVILPAAIAAPRTDQSLARVEAMAQRADAGDVEGLAQLLLAEQPEGLRQRRVVQMWARMQATRLASPAIAPVVRDIPRLHPLDDAAELAAVTCPVLVIGQEDDEAHPSRLVHELAEALPDARTEVFSPGGVVWSHRAELRRLISAFLN
jgi:pimeloyl-ACP methyl ester carboxylesterase